MDKEQIIKALYSAKTLATIQKANDNWSVAYQAASESDKEYLMAEYHKYGEYVMEKSRLSSLEVQKVLAEFEAMKLAESQHQ